MNHYLFLTVKEKSTGKIGIVLDVSVDKLYVAFPTDSKWLEEDEITEPIL